MTSPDSTDQSSGDTNITVEGDAAIDTGQSTEAAPAESGDGGSDAGDGGESGSEG